MTYDVDWGSDPLSVLATIWMRHPNHRAVSAAQRRIDRLLAADPHGNGTPVSEGLNAIEVPPLRALYEIDDVRQIVKVVSLSELP